MLLFVVDGTMSTSTRLRAKLWFEELVKTKKNLIVCFVSSLNLHG